MNARTRWIAEVSRSLRQRDLASVAPDAIYEKPWASRGLHRAVLSVAAVTDLRQRVVRRIETGYIGFAISVIGS